MLWERASAAFDQRTREEALPNQLLHTYMNIAGLISSATSVM
jgi:hypothetical protein